MTLLIWFLGYLRGFLATVTTWCAGPAGSSNVHAANPSRSWRWLEDVAQRSPALFAHRQSGVLP